MQQESHGGNCVTETLKQAPSSNGLLARNDMTVQQFDAATDYVKRTMLKCHGVLLLKAESNIWLYELDGFYVEINFDKQIRNRPLIKSCSNEALEKYLSLIDISPILGLL